LRRRALLVRAWLSARLAGLTETVAGWGAGPSAPTGVSLAFAPGGDSVGGRRAGGARRVPVRSAVIALTVGVIGVTAALTYNSSLDHFTDVPRFRGWDWDAAIGNISTPADAAAAERDLTGDPAIGTFSGVGLADVRVNGQDQPLLWLTTDHGVVGPTVLAGRLPVVAGEVALASGSMRRAGTHLGGSVQVGTGLRATTLRVVGEVLGPAVLVDGVRLDTGVVLTHDAATVLGESVYQEPTSFLVRFRAGMRRSAVVAELDRVFPGSVLEPTTPGDVTNVERLAAMPFVLAGLLVALGLSALVIALDATVDRRSEQLLSLRALGFSRRQLCHTIVWQAAALVAAAIAIGLPLGALAGRVVWVATAETIGVPAPAIVPWSVALGAAVMAAAALAVAIWPGRRAAKSGNYGTVAGVSSF
jgi:putative ABC transport system permease protein